MADPGDLEARQALEVALGAPVQPVCVGLAVAETAPRVLHCGDEWRVNLLIGLYAYTDQPQGLLFGQEAQCFCGMVFLASDASHFMTGQAIVVDGGMIMLG